MSSSFAYVPPCMILDDDELEQAQEIRETFSKGRSYAAVAASASSASPSWRSTPSQESTNHSRLFGTSQSSSSRTGGNGGFPNAFHSYGTRPSHVATHASQEGEGSAAAAAATMERRRRRHESNEPPGTLLRTVRMTFYNSALAAAAPPPLTIPSKTGEGPPYSPKTPPYYEEQEPNRQAEHPSTE
jgi:hypothetical protein